MKNLVNNLSSVKDFLLNLIFPKECLGCGQEGRYLCQLCQSKILLNQKNYCAFCHKESSLSKICQLCQKESPLLNIWVAADYNNEILQSLIHNLKYKYIEESSQSLAGLIISYLEKNKIFSLLAINRSNAVMVPVPLHKKRYLERGFNQSFLLAKEISDFYKIEIGQLLRRRVNTISQVNLKRNERQANIQNAFVFQEDKLIDKNKKIILIDDVITTGSTLNECAKVLAKSGFKEIYGLAIAQRDD
ncbi:MAG TPA: ComF family protein [Candidatus Uhrbacteria bacterium]|nr:ComF family protein [Candidatus Uhrbacteria bacterium]